MKNIKFSLAWQILFAMVLGILLGSYLHYHSDSRDWLVVNLLSPAGDIFIHLIKMIVVPIVISTLVVGIAGVGDAKQLGRIGAKTIIYFEVITTVAIILGITLANVFQPGAGVDMSQLATVDISKYQSTTEAVQSCFPARGFRRPMPQLISQIELAAMQDKLAAMGAQNAQLKNALIQAQNQPVAEVTETEVIVPDPDIAPRTVFFTIGSAELSPREIMNLSYLAEQMKQFPNATYTVNGYADSATGTPAFNKELSLKRAQAVKDALVKNYGIAADRLNIEAGGGVDKFGQPILNRVVLVKSAN